MTNWQAGVAATLLAACIVAAAAWANGVNQRFIALDETLRDVRERVVHIETVVELLSDRVLPYGGRPAYFTEEYCELPRPRT